MITSARNEHSEIKRAGQTQFTSKAMALSRSDRAGTRIDELPQEQFYTQRL